MTMKMKIMFWSALLLIVLIHSACRPHPEADQSPQTATNSSANPSAPPVGTNAVQIPSWDHTNDSSISNWSNPNQVPPTNKP